MFEGKDEIRVAVVAGGSVQPCTLAGSDAWRVVVGGGGGLHTRVAGSGAHRNRSPARSAARTSSVLTSQCGAARRDRGQYGTVCACGVAGTYDVKIPIYIHAQRNLIWRARNALDT